MTSVSQEELQRIARNMVNEHVCGNVGAMVEYILSKSYEDSDVPFSIDDINLYPDPSDWDSDRLLEYIHDELGMPEWEIATDDDEDDARDYIRDNAEPAEVFEWWAVSDWLRYQLEEAGEIILDAGGIDVWGRCTTGQAIYMDYVIRQIALRQAQQ